MIDLEVSGEGRERNGVGFVASLRSDRMGLSV